MIFINRLRTDKVIANMKKHGLTQILVTTPMSVYYLTGLMVHPGERMLALTIDESGECALYANRLFALSTVPHEVKLIEFDDTDDCVRLLAKGLRPGALGVDKAWPSGFLVRLMEARGDIAMRLGSPPVDEARMIKDEEELRLLRESSLLNDKSVGELIGMLNPGQTEKELGGYFSAMGKEKGARDGFTPLVCFGKNCAEPHHDSDDTILKSGDCVILDLGYNLNGYSSDMTRTVFLHSATDEQKRVYDIVLRANLAAIAAVRPGVKLSEIDGAARGVIEAAGYGPRFIHRTGHGIGLEEHEPPDVSQTSDVVVQPGMVFSIEPGIYLPGKFGVRIEDLVAVTENGCEVLNKLDKSLTIVP